MRIHIEILKDRRFRNFFLGVAAIFFGAGLTLIAASWYILEETGQSKMIALSWIATLISGPFILAYSGALIDRFDRRRLIILMAFMRAAAIAYVPIAIYLHIFSLWQIYLIFFIEGIGFNISIPAEKALLQKIVSRDKYIVSNSITEMAIQTAMFISAGACGYIFSKIGLAGVMAIDSLTYVLGAVFFMRIPKGIPHLVTSPDDGSGYFSAVADGWRYLFKNKMVFAIGIVSFIPLTIAFISNAVTAPYVFKTLGRGAAEYGMIEMCYGLGALASGIAAPYAIRLGRKRLSKYLSLLLLATLLAIPFNRYLFFGLLGYTVFGFSNASMRIIFTTILMEVSPNEFMGRISSAAMMMAFIVQILSFVAIGFIADSISIASGFFYICVFAAVMVVVSFMSGRIPNRAGVYGK